MQTFYERSDIDNRLFSACEKIDFEIARQYDPTQPGTYIGNLLAAFMQQARSAMLLSFWDIASEDARKLSAQSIDEIVEHAAKD
jgi:hypothetical protein